MRGERLAAEHLTDIGVLQLEPVPFDPAEEIVGELQTLCLATGPVQFDQRDLEFGMAGHERAFGGAEVSTT